MSRPDVSPPNGPGPAHWTLAPHGTPPLPTLGVVVVTYNSVEHVTAALGSLRAATRAATAVVVVDNASSDDTVEAVGRTCPGALVLESSVNYGFARACNMGAAAIQKTDLLLFLNPDVELDPGALDVAIGHLVADPGIGALGGRTRNRDGSLNPTCCFARPTLWSAFCYATGLASVMRHSSTFNPEALGAWDRNDTRDVDVVTGCFLLMRTADFHGLGGFDERFFLYSEDTDLSARVRDAGLRCVHAGDVGLVHVGGGSDRVRSEKLTKVFRARRQYYDKHWNPVAAGLGGWLIDAAVGLRLVATSVGARGRRRQWRDIWNSRSVWRHDPPQAVPVPAPEISPPVRLAPRPWSHQARIGYRTLRHVTRSIRSRDLDFVAQGIETGLRLPGLVVWNVLGPDRRECNVCGWTGPRFFPNTGPGYHEQSVTCPGCSCQDRHRSLLALLVGRTDMLEGGRRVIEVAPMRGFEALMQAQPGLDYTSFDIERHAMEQGDITRMRYQDDSVDYFICFHVLEHIPDADAALDEIHRVLAPGGTAVFQVPVDWEAPSTREYDAPDPRDVGHVRQYGSDFPKVLERAGFDVERCSVVDLLPAGTVRRFGMSPEPIFLARKTGRA
ncbi:glycosyltransferase [Nocardioides sp. MAHUQ-72]|uniref:glycosyltransferase n=1 Tax=unclassified Nocardioides TaxID=2615069 RepID=UPI00360B1413